MLPSLCTTDRRYALLLAGVCMLFFLPLVSPNAVVDAPDIVRQFYPWREFARTSAGGAFPRWLPDTLLGEPLVANPQLAAFYPPDRLLLHYLPTHQAIDYGLLLHLVLAGVGGYLLARRLIGDPAGALAAAAVWMFSSYFVLHLAAGHYSLVTAASWMPLVLLLGDIAFECRCTSYALLAGAALGLQLLAGHPQTVFLTCIALAVFWLVRYIKSLSHTSIKHWLVLLSILALIVVSGVGLSAVQLVPTWELNSLSTRAGGVDYAFATDYSLPPYLLPSVLAPDLLGSPLTPGSFSEWEYTGYIGVLPIVFVALCLVLKRPDSLTRILFAAAGFAMILALGRYTRLYWLLWKYAPGFNLFRAPARFLLLFTLAIALLTGIALELLNESLGVAQLRRMRNFAHVVLGLAVLAGLAASPLARTIWLGAGERALRWRYGSDVAGHLEQLGRIGQFASADLLRLALLLAAALVLVYWRSRAASPPRWFSAAAIALIVINLWLVYGRSIQVVGLADLRGESPAVRFLEEHRGLGRVYDPHDLLFPNAQGRPTNSNILYGIKTLGGYNPVTVAEVDALLQKLNTSSLAQNHRALDLLNVRYVISREPLQEDWLSLAFDSDGIHIYENARALPGTFPISEEAAACNGDLFECAESAPTLTGLRSSEIAERWKTGRSGPDDLDIELDVKSAGVLVVGETYYPGWKVFVNGSASEVLRVFRLYRGVRVSPGHNQIHFAFEPESLSLGKTISEWTGGLMLAGFVLVVLQQKRRAKVLP